MDIRRATDADIPQVLDLLVQVCNVHANGRPDLFVRDTTKYTADELSQIFRDDSAPVFVAVEPADVNDPDARERVLGYAFCIYQDWNGNNATGVRTLYVDDICVDAAARGKHVGTSLYNHVIDFARGEGFHNVTLNVWSCNPGALKFYEAMGMKPQKIGMETIL
ncbi:GNAT family N-acetyltransferase [Parafannyhessea umbonata]|jgi:ribosomal protein S18 acetylase RimI-like enzyme|uniref:GNAT family N-acetyltransferase n=1 Tax=Parafannyhessea umbonata TaxID=604330 RepID=UPI001567DCE6|nr:GNAT family N-acetyltransferase [Parafannyhessea umbonata]